LRLLLDSNVFFWSVFNRSKLTPRVLHLLEEDQNELFVSRASIWELSIKVAKGRLEMPGSSIRYMLEQSARTGMTVLPIEDAHVLRTETLPHHHRDPFDRILVAQALEEGLTILTSDSEIPKYDAPVIWR
jgi:PIN domain nuclease of toxin-antitoxin system